MPQLLIVVFSIMSISPPIQLKPQKVVIAPYLKEFQAIAASSSSEQMNELLIDRDKRIMSFLRNLSVGTQKKVKAPGISVENGHVQIQITEIMNADLIAMENVVLPVIIELSGDQRNSGIERLKHHGINAKDLKAILRFIPKNFDMNQWTLRETMDFMNQTEYSIFLNNPKAIPKSFSDNEIQTLLETQRACSDFVSRSFFIQLMEPLSAHGRLVLLKLGFDINHTVKQSRRLLDQVTQQEIDHFRKLLQNIDTTPDQNQ